MFPDPGTVIASALEQSIEIFKAFQFLEASGNLMVIFTDGEDTTSLVHGRSLDDILKSGGRQPHPALFVRTNYQGLRRGHSRRAVASGGGEDRRTLLRGPRRAEPAAASTTSIGRRWARSRSRRYTSRQPRFALLALAAAGCWLRAAGLRLGGADVLDIP